MDATDKKYIDRARTTYALPSNDNIEIDDNPRTSFGGDGVWVAAWVFVPYEAGESEYDERYP